ncbi:hypothetical protein [Sphingomonas sp. BAUL-RG-20F-R05-02]|uniref:hypothetical protein n=1 Tax=Sphingomonas sp. BAUL-RG-20F-R05-02 TaxID=2914830 RepID=UPI001F5948EF|nr:hypothetical protein [Sphingomonas sp. BAUL-RG-20F-R05-02]
MAGPSLSFRGDAVGGEGDGIFFAADRFADEGISPGMKLKLAWYRHPDEELIMAEGTPRTFRLLEI